MKADPKGVLTGVHFIDGDHACCEGALAAGEIPVVAGFPFFMVMSWGLRISTCFLHFMQKPVAMSSHSCSRTVGTRPPENRIGVALLACNWPTATLPPYGQ